MRCSGQTRGCGTQGSVLAPKSFSRTSLLALATVRTHAAKISRTVELRTLLLRNTPSCASKLGIYPATLDMNRAYSNPHMDL